MKNLIYIGFIIIALASCSSSKKNLKHSKDKESNAKVTDTIKIGAEDSEFRLIIFDPRFNGWLAANARPRGYYSENFLKENNRLMAIEWNIRFDQPQRFDPDLYSMYIDYDIHENYGYEVNYLLYNYFIFFQLTYNQRLSSSTPRP